MTDFFANPQSSIRPAIDGGRFLGTFVSRNQSSDESVLVGWTGGAGMEYALNKLWSLGLEFRHNGFASHTFHFSSNRGVITPGNSSVDIDSDQLTFKVNFYLGHL